MPEASQSYVPGETLTAKAMIGRGLRRKCPHCGIGRAFDGYLKQTDTCDHCGEDIGRIRAEDGPAWLTIIVVGHLLAIPMAEAYLSYGMSAETGMILWPTLAMIMTFGFMPLIKGMWLALIWRFKAPGSGDEDRRIN